MLNRVLYAAAFSGALSITTACAPSIETGACDADTPCAGRGQMCNLMTSTCEAAELATDSTDEASPTTFTDVEVPFFRGEICVPHEVKSGSTIPVSLSPCMHPCLAASSFEFKHFFSCVGSSCDAYATMWVVADSVPENCPADAFGRFDRAMCTYPMDPVNLGIATSLESGPISGSMLLEVPFLSNADIAEISASGSDQDLFESLVFQYPQDNGRVPDGRAIQLLPENPEPPEACNGAENCPCYDIGFK
ncbi:MAG: hypothetical protein AAF721_20075 [Myxococcota bacterium]